MKTVIMVVMAMAFLVSTASAEMLYKAKTSGMVMKDSIELHVVDDPDIKGVSCYFTLPKRSMSFVDQTNTSISCRKVGPISGKMTNRKKVFSASKSWMVKKLVIDRIYDKKRNALIYMSYTKKMSGDNASNSVSVVVLD